jgi:hypothetical protein
VDSPVAGRAELRLAGGGKVVISGLADDRPEAFVAALRQALKAAQATARKAAGEKAA